MKIYIKDIDGNPVGIGQTVVVEGTSSTGYAVFLVTYDGNLPITEHYETEAAAIASINEGGGTTVIIDDLRQ